MSELDAARYPRTWRVLAAALGRWADEAGWPLEVWERGWALGVGPTLASFARGRGVAIPAQVVRLELASGAAGVLRRRRMGEVLGAMAGVRCMVHKGDPLAVSLYGEVRRRGSGDIDLLVDVGEIEAAEGALRGLGYAPRYGLERPEPWLVDEWGFVQAGTGQVVELHWGLSAPHIPSPGFEALWGARREVEVEGIRCQVLGQAHEVLGLCYHFHHHVGHLKGLVDVASWLDRYGRGAAWGEAWGLARGMGVSGVMGWPQGVIGRLGGRRSGSGCLAGWTAGEVIGCLGRGGAGVEDKTEGLSQAQVAMWQGVGGLALDAWGGRIGAALHPFFYSPRVWAARRGSEAVGWSDVMRWGMRPGELAMKQLKNVIIGR